MAKAQILQGTDYGINQDYPDEIVQARSRLWERKSKYRQGKVYFSFQAKLVVDAEVACDEFPDWKDILKGSRVEQNTTNPDSKTQLPGRGSGRGRESSQQRPGAAHVVQAN